MNKLKEKLLRGEKALGFHIQSRDIQMTEMIASLGFDYLWIDMEHSALQSTEVEDHLYEPRYQRQLYAGAEGHGISV